MNNSEQYLPADSLKEFSDEALAELLETKQKYQAFLEGTNVGTWEWNVQTGETKFNDRWAQILGYSLEELAPTTIDTWLELAHPDDLEKSNQALQACFSGEAEFYDVECRMRHSDGHWIWVLDRGNVFSRNDAGEPLMMYGTHLDISEQKNREEKLRKSEQAFSNSFQYAGIGMAIVGTDGHWLQVNRELCQILGYPENELLKLTFQDITLRDDLEKDLSLFEEVIAGKRNNYQIEKRYLHRDGHIVYAVLSVAVVRRADGSVDNFISQILDISDLRLAQEQITELLERAERQNQLLRDTQIKLEAANASLLEQSVTDPLTALGNRRVLNTALDRELQRSRRSEDGKLSVIILDVDFFKTYNDRFGHPEGDRALKMLADILSRECRAYDIVTRFGGEEFAILLPDTDRKTAFEVAERIRSTVEQAQWPNQLLTISLGVCGWMQGMEGEELIRFADNALYQAKNKGRNCTISWLPRREVTDERIAKAS
ncbi:sensor domain-containing diguanylate cyclase [Methylophaga sp.]|jgi:diguanylate cyclase (GGDEF)-like protein/PAS domain S-box-containing protein|uniref:sensor domain-containing diguanylate cyclase n=1 Tax=Methylophaga sp. TaxID=2024840 RepID=UPI001400DA40|nr:diguanylate cyclase [Methylophaga sp.]MTI63522.1 diguanylate cyclase [Methylophaga sp.]